MLINEEKRCGFSKFVKLCAMRSLSVNSPHRADELALTHVKRCSIFT